MSNDKNSENNEPHKAISEKHFRGMVESTASIPWIVDLNTFQFIYVGPQAEKILGYPVSAWYEKDFWPDHIHPDDREAALKYYNERSQKSQDYNFEYRMTHHDGHSIWILDYVNVVTEDEKPVQLQGFMFDISKNKQNEISQLQNKERLNETQMIASLGSWELDLSNNELFWSDEIFRIFELDANNFNASYEAFLAAIHPDDREAVNNAYTQSLKTKEPYNIEHRLLMPDGRIKYVEEHCKTEYNDHGEPQRSIGTVQDISQRKLTERTLQKRNSLLSAMYSASPDMIFIHAADGRILDANKNAIHRYGFTLEEIQNKTVADLSANNAPIDLAISYINDAIAGLKPEFEWLAKDIDGTLFPVEVRLRKLGGDGGPDDPAVIAVARDISERKQAEESINNIAAGVSAKSGDAFYQNLVKHLGKLFKADYAFIGLIDEDKPKTINTIAVFAHGSAADNMSYSLINTPCAEVVGETTCCHPFDVQLQYPNDQLLSDMGVDSYIGTPLFDSQGTPIGLIVVMDSNPMQVKPQLTEILEIFAARASAEIERTKTHRQLENTQQKLALHIQETPLGVIEWDTHFRVMDWNPSAEKIFGYNKHEAVGKSAKELLIPDEFLPHVDAIWQSLLNNQGGTRSTNDNITKTGSIITCEWYNTPLIAEGGTVIGVASLVLDVTERTQTNLELKEHRDNLEALVEQRTMELRNANQELESFSYSVSHDLRAPLRHIDGFSQALQEDYADKLDDDGKNLLTRIRAGAQRMGLLIDDLLKLSHVARGNMERGTLNISNMSQDILTKLQNYDPSRKINITITPELTVSADHRLVNILLENIISNAWKYTSKTDNANIVIDASVGEKGGPIFCVCDNGAGFDMQQAEKLFTAFSRLHSNEEFEGTGIGLATVQRIINRHGGRIWAESKPGKGAKFYFSLGG